MTLSLRRGEITGWTSWNIRHGSLELALVPQVGGRVMGALWDGHNIFFVHPELEGQVPELPASSDVLQQKQARGFSLWGGDKTWLAPQERWNQGTPFLDLDSGPYDLEVVTESSDQVVVSMTSRPCRETSAQITRTISVSENQPGWQVTHRLVNTGSESIAWELWDVAMVLRPATVYLPRSAASEYPDGIKTYPAEGDSVAARNDVIQLLGGVAAVRCDESRAFKFGVDGGDAWILSVIRLADGRLLSYCKEMAAFPHRSYAHGCVAEVYNADGQPYFEMELHGPQIPLLPGESFEISEPQCIRTLDQPPRSVDEIRAMITGQLKT